MNILIFYPYNLRSVEQQSVMELLVKKGHKVVLLTTCKQGPLHIIASKLGVIAEHLDYKEKKYFFYLNNIRKLYTTLKKYQVDIVIAHQQRPALIAGFLQKFIAFKLFYVRHNSDEDYLSFPVKAKWLNKFVNAVTKVKIAPSGRVQKYWMEEEKVNAADIHRINYGYNFQQYEAPDLQKVHEIREQFATQLLIISIARFVPAKRHKEMFQAIRQMKTNGVDCKLICLGTGPLENELQVFIKENELQASIFLLGRKENVFDYIKAADIFLHLSTTEASNSAVKEVGLCKKPVIVCREVGDFEEYIVDKENSFLVDKENPVPAVCNILYSIVNNQIDTIKVGKNLYETVINNFPIERVAAIYDEIINFDSSLNK